MTRSSADREAAPIITLLTDFGLSDPYVGIMKGVLLRGCPELRLVDVSHDVPPHDVALASYWLARAHAFFPEGSVHLCVVDPGVGSSRAPLAARVGAHTFVAPDNGLLSDVLRSAESPVVRRIDAELLGLSPASRTFHGRDLFAPVAARLASGDLAFDAVGTLHEPVLLSRPEPTVAGDAVSGVVLFVDRFGNAITNIAGDLVPDAGSSVAVAGARLRVLGTYADAEPLECIGLVSSFGTLEVARRDGSAAAALGIAPGTPLRLIPREPS